MATQLNDWLSIDKISGTGNAQITLTASSYSELVDRAASIKIQAQTTNAILNVRQTALVPSATLDSYETTAYRASTYTNGITSNVPWTAVVNGDWITIDKTQGESGYTPLSITVDATTETRNGSIVFNAEGVVLTLQIYQIYDLKQAYFWVEFENTGGTISGLTNTYTDMYHSFDGITWLTTPNTLSMGDNTLVYFKNNSKKITNNWLKYLTIKFNSNAKVGGDISSLTDMIDCCCYGLFENNKYLTDASELILPWDTSPYYGYSSMFQGCTSLTTAPELPATTLVLGCYEYMFQGCTSLTTAPILPATTLVEYCYSNMFQGCTSLTTAPELPATTVADYCYYSMFQGCTSLVSVPSILPATTLAENCYYHMFQGCTNLATAPELPATTLAESCYSYMFADCTSLTTAPELPATTLAITCYGYMFNGCINLNYIKMLATYYALGSLNVWVENVSSTGTFIKHPDAEIESGAYGIPDGWTVETATE